jgi:hypothetical protein
LVGTFKFSTFNQGCATTFMRSPLAPMHRKSEIYCMVKPSYEIFSCVLLFLLSCGSEVDNSIPINSDTIETLPEETVSIEIEPEIDLASEKFLNIPESAITENDVLNYVNKYRPSFASISAFRKDSALNKAVAITSNRNFTNENYIINTLLLKQTLFNAQDQCMTGYNMNHEKDPVIEWLREFVAKELNMEYKLSEELFPMSELYYFIKENPDNRLDFDTSYIRRIDVTLDSCDKHFLID